MCYFVILLFPNKLIFFFWVGEGRERGEMGGVMCWTRKEGSGVKVTDFCHIRSTNKELELRSSALVKRVR